MGDPNRGVYRKFDVRRTDGRSEPGGKHHDCNYFVLDLTHDPHARRALLAYADSCDEEEPLLARDIRAKIRSGEWPCGRSSPTTFMIGLYMKRDDAESDGIGRVLAVLSHEARGVCGGGGYVRGRPDLGREVLLVMQRNGDDGGLLPCDEEDRERAARVLADHPDVAAFTVGGLSFGESSSESYEHDERTVLDALRFVART